MDSVDVDSLAWRAVELAVQRRDDPRLIVATRPTIVGPASTARLIAGLCNAAAGRRVVALFGVDGTDVIGLEGPPDENWLDAITQRFPGVVPDLATATIDADGAHIVALTADDPGTLVVASRSGRIIIPWFDGALADRPPENGLDRGPTRPTRRLEIRSGWLERTGTCALDPAAPADVSAGESSVRDDPAGDVVADERSGIVVWRGMLDIALALDALTTGAGWSAGGGAAATAAARNRLLPSGSAVPEGLGAGTASGDGPRPRRHGVTITDRDVSVTLLADGSAAALSLDVQVFPTPGATAALRSDGALLLDPLVPCRLYLAAAAAAPVFDQPGDLGGAVRLLVSLRVPGDDRLVASMATLGSEPSEASRRWTL